MPGGSIRLTLFSNQGVVSPIFYFISCAKKCRALETGPLQLRYNHDMPLSRPKQLNQVNTVID
jgi:hypothetical protein